MLFILHLKKNKKKHDGVPKLIPYMLDFCWVFEIMTIFVQIRLCLMMCPLTEPNTRPLPIFYHHLKKLPFKKSFVKQGCMIMCPHSFQTCLVVSELGKPSKGWILMLKFG